ncbi:hypothetical protein GCM10025885_02690 [Tetragenococcus osmophilus]|uniref:ABC transporter domain-containing protein n=1 Tax=Tetragenococcus osmophilus TaxID=526944 RepID=A0AA37XIF6_9ENTE|nr:hypothetical protein GCM10025885_02690 [Tetragenococcus osmophilus]
MLVLEDLSKSFGNYRAVDQLSFTINKGKIMGLIGQNGAGKTTTFRLILNFLQADEGEIWWNGHKLSTKEYNTIGYLPEERGLYPRVTIYDQLIYFARLRGKTKKKLLLKLMSGWNDFK